MAIQPAMHKPGIANAEHTATDAAEALEFLRSKFIENHIQPSQLVTLGCWLPRMNAHGLLSGIGIDPGFVALVVFVPTASDRPEEVFLA